MSLKTNVYTSDVSPKKIEYEKNNKFSRFFKT